MDADSAPARSRQGWWWKALLAGLALWLATIVVTSTTHNTNLIPTLILLGSFLVPFCVVLFAAERISGTLAQLDAFMAFFLGGAFGVLGASLLEGRLDNSPWRYLQVALVEEFVKALILLVLGRAVVPKTAPQGALLGACIGAGFAAFESAGYAFNAAVTSQGIDLGSLLQSEAARSILTPLCHVLWTALLGAVIFGAATRTAGATNTNGTAHGTTNGTHGTTNGTHSRPVANESPRYRLTGVVLGTFAGVVVLHALWDSMQELAGDAAAVVLGATGPAVRGSADQLQLVFSGLYVAGLVLVAASGVGALALVLRRDTGENPRRPRGSAPGSGAATKPQR
ncbi:PrsW family glutamic-type intramembrane protease [Sinomonas albida]|uniref:PrsW family glutamic-type intramembrane protease n=1 Tax=Sinomonas albida TaxID=369942 RepID=UPI0010A887BB|nr:PrsW family glutamic-type intramembrane protease [Sinomonas albida]